MSSFITGMWGEKLTKFLRKSLAEFVIMQTVAEYIRSYDGLNILAMIGCSFGPVINTEY